jgi:rhodanese-related sulfurtransferase
MPTTIILKEELKKKVDQDETFELVNVLSPDHYGRGLIKGSLKIPLAQLQKRYVELDAKQEIITYCAGILCTASKQAAEFLASKGFNVRAYEGGLDEWIAAGYPMEENTVASVG